MKNKKLPIFLALIFVFTSLSLQLIAQDGMSVHSHEMGAATGYKSSSFLFSMMELPFLLIAVVFAFLTANALKGGKFGKGMYLVAWGFVVMAVGHMHMQIDHLYGINLFNTLLGSTAGSIAWFLALIVTWGLSSLGFYSIYKSSKG